MTYTTITRLPANWDVWEGGEHLPGFESAIRAEVSRLVKRRNPDYYVSGDHINGPVGSPDLADEIYYGDNEWVSDLYAEAFEAAYEQCIDEEETK